jgi:hypothetical protein
LPGNHTGTTTMKRSTIAIALVIFLGLAILAASSGVAMAQTTPAPTPTGATYKLQQSSTQTPDFLDCIGSDASIGTCIVYTVTLTVSDIMGVFVSLGALVVKLGLSFNQGIYNSPFIQNGFSPSSSSRLPPCSAVNHMDIKKYYGDLLPWPYW